jgi:uncharacterized protein YbjT (DUF2867 family)
MYTIMGVSGRVGGAVARVLLARGEPLRVVVRDASKGERWAAAGCEVAIADLDNEDGVARAFAGVEGAFVMLPPLFDPSLDFAEAKAMIATLRGALQAARPKRVVALSTIGADASRPNLLSQLGLLEQALSALAIPVTFLRAAWFMENAALDIGSARETGVIASYLQPLNRAISMIATADVGRTAADLLQEPGEGVRFVELEAARRVSPDAIAAAFSRALGKPITAQAVAAGAMGSDLPPARHEKSAAPDADARRLQRRLDRVRG